MGMLPYAHAEKHLVVEVQNAEIVYQKNAKNADAIIFDLENCVRVVSRFGQGSSMTESEIQKRVRVEASKQGFTAFRNNRGFAWQGAIKKIGNMIQLFNPRRIEFGLTNGASDLIGFKSIKITKEMVGKNIAVFSAIECKAQNGKLSEHQKNFLTRVKESGGISIVSKSEADIKRGLEEWNELIMKP